MKTLSNYQEAMQTELFNKTGSFFAYSETQFNEGIQKIKDNAEVNGYNEGDKWTNIGSGLFCLSKHKELLQSELENIYTSSIEQDKAENGKESIIKRELYNYECFYTGSIRNAVYALKDYGYTREDVHLVYLSELPQAQSDVKTGSPLNLY